MVGAALSSVKEVLVRALLQKPRASLEKLHKFLASASFPVNERGGHFVLV